MVIYKFGGASVKDAASVRNAAEIIRNTPERLFLVVSAMGKTTNKLEEIVLAFFHRTGEAAKLLEELKTWHIQLAQELFHLDDDPVFAELEQLVGELYWCIEEVQVRDFDFEYDQIVAYGELFSSAILSAYLRQTGYAHRLIDARGLIKTDNTYREAKVDWDRTSIAVKEQIKAAGNVSLLTQGFIGGTSENFSTTLGREGSDYTASIIAFCADASEVVIWKDVPGVFNADPRIFPEAKLISELSYYDAIEQAYYGASIIHPKTIKPLQNKQIPLRVRSFIDLNQPGTLISESFLPESAPTYILKSKQTVLSISPFDFSFIAEEHLSDIFHLLHEYRVKVNLMQNSALNFTVCMNVEGMAFEKLKTALGKIFRIRYNEECTLMTIRHYTEELFQRFSAGKEIILEQRSRNTVQFVYR